MQPATGTIVKYSSRESCRERVSQAFVCSTSNTADSHCMQLSMQSPGQKPMRQKCATTEWTNKPSDEWQAVEATEQNEQQRGKASSVQQEEGQTGSHTK